MTKKTAKKRKTRPRHQSGPFRVARSRTGLGLFAEAPIRKGRFIIEYWGKRVRWADVEDTENKYFFDVSKQWAIDGSDRRNTARYINHSCKPNAVPYESGGRIRIYAKRTIEPGEEITYNYGKEYFDSILAPIGCKCVACAHEAKPRKIGAKRRRNGGNG